MQGLATEEPEQQRHALAALAAREKGSGMEHLATDRLRLRPLGPRDAVAVASLMTPAISRRLSNFPVPFTVEDAGIRIRRILDAEAGRRACVYAFERRSDCVFTGWFGVYRDSGRSCGVLGYWLEASCQGEGLMREGAPVALAGARVRLNLEAIEAYIHPDNAPSLALARSLGMQIVGETMIHASARGREELCLHLAAR